MDLPDLKMDRQYVLYNLNLKEGKDDHDEFQRVITELQAVERNRLVEADIQLEDQDLLDLELWHDTRKIRIKIGVFNIDVMGYQKMDNQCTIWELGGGRLIPGSRPSGASRNNYSDGGVAHRDLGLGAMIDAFNNLWLDVDVQGAIQTIALTLIESAKFDWVYAEVLRNIDGKESKRVPEWMPFLVNRWEDLTRLAIRPLPSDRKFPEELDPAHVEMYVARNLDVFGPDISGATYLARVLIRVPHIV